MTPAKGVPFLGWGRDNEDKNQAYSHVLLPPLKVAALPMSKLDRSSVEAAYRIHRRITAGAPRAPSSTGNEVNQDLDGTGRVPAAALT